MADPSRLVLRSWENLRLTKLTIGFPIRAGSLLKDGKRINRFIRDELIAWISGSSSRLSNLLKGNGKMRMHWEKVFNFWPKWKTEELAHEWSDKTWKMRQILQCMKPNLFKQFSMPRRKEVLHFKLSPRKTIKCFARRSQPRMFKSKTDQSKVYLQIFVH